MLLNKRWAITDNKMPRRKTKNITGLARIEGIPYHDAWVGFICLSCGSLNNIRIGLQLLDPKTTCETAEWKCNKCGYLHSKNSDLPFENWSEDFTVAESIKAQRFWEAFSEYLRSIPNHTGSNAMPAAEFCHLLHLANIPGGDRLNGKWNAEVVKAQ